jgi:hypothetical protein
MDALIGRREFLGVILASPVARALGQPAVQGVRAFRLKEVAGLKRFGYPVQTIVPDAVEGRNFRLIRDGRAIPAQFRVVQVAPGHKELYLDFNASPEPLETQQYQVLFGWDVEPGPEPQSNLKVEEHDGRLSVTQSSPLAFHFAKRPSGFLESVGGPRLEYLRPGSASLTITEKELKPDQTLPEAIELRTCLTREGPLAIGLHSEWAAPSGQRSAVDYTIPQSKSWVQVAWTVEDPNQRVSSLGVDLQLQLEGSPTLVDFGAGSTIYGQIKNQQRMEMIAGRGENLSGGWVVRQGEGEKLSVLAASTPERPRLAEGWAHVMDARRCTAVAIADFGKRNCLDRISIEANGHLKLVRDFPDSAKGQKSLAFWLHFVPMPVQVGAATSPQSILDPLRVEWDR